MRRRSTDVWVAHLDGWAAVHDLLREEDWELCGGTDPRSPAVFHGGDGVYVFEGPGTLTAQQRRALHRAGLRPHRSELPRVWEWAVPDEELPAVSPRTPDSTGWATTTIARMHAVQDRISAQAVVLLRDALRLPVSQVVVLLPRDELDAWADEGWEDDGSEDDDLGDDACRLLG